MREEITHRLEMRTWMGLFLLAICFWIVINGYIVILEVSAAIFSGLLASTVLRSLADFFESRWGLNRSLSVIFLLISAQVPLAILSGILIYWGLDMAGTASVGLYKFINLSGLPAQPVLQRILDMVNLDDPQALDSLIQGTASMAANAFNLLDFIMLLTLANLVAFAFSQAPLEGRRMVEVWIPPGYQEPFWRILERTEWRLGRWVLFQLGSMAFFAVSFSLGLSLLGVPYGPVIGILGGFLEIAPGMGGFLAFIIALFSAYTMGDEMKMLLVVPLYIAVFILQNNVLATIVVEKSLKLHGIMVLIAVILGGKISGIWGGLFAIPVLIVVLAFMQELREYYYPAVEEPIEKPLEGAIGPKAKT
jgi:predicted PurR-regulated permease PerM